MGMPYAVNTNTGLNIVPDLLKSILSMALVGDSTADVNGVPHIAVKADGIIAIFLVVPIVDGGGMSGPKGVKGDKGEFGV